MLFRSCEASCTSQHKQKSEMMERASTIYLYTQHPLSRVTGEEKVNTCKPEESDDARRVSEVWLNRQIHGQRGGSSNLRINCTTQDSNSRPWALIPCQASCTSQRNQKSELMERASIIHIYCNNMKIIAHGDRKSVV